jgi:hypothetical protein
MSDVISTRIPPGLDQQLADYCAKQGVSRTEVVLNALDEFFARHGQRPNAYQLAADLIPPKGVASLQSDQVRTLARAAFGAKRAR